MRAGDAAARDPEAPFCLSDAVCRTNFGSDASATAPADVCGTVRWTVCPAADTVPVRTARAGAAFAEAFAEGQEAVFAVLLFVPAEEAEPVDDASEAPDTGEAPDTEETPRACETPDTGETPTDGLITGSRPCPLPLRAGLRHFRFFDRFFS